MAGNTPDSEVSSDIGVDNQPPIGGGPGVTPKGMPGAPPLGGGLPGLGGPMGPGMEVPKTPKEQEEETLNKRGITTLIEDVVKYLELAQGESNVNIDKDKAQEVYDYLLETGWTIKRIKNIIRNSNLEAVEFLKTIVKKVEKSGEKEAIDYMQEKLKPEGESEASGMLTPPPGIPAATPDKGMTTSPPAPPIPEPLAKANRTDVGLHKFSQGDVLMNNTKKSQVVIQDDGTLTQVPVKESKVLGNLVMSIQKTKSAMKKVEDEKIKFAGVRALTLKKAEDFGGPPIDDADGDPEIDEIDDDGMDFEDDSTEIASEDALEAVDHLEQAIDILKGNAGAAEAEIGELEPDFGGEMEPEEVMNIGAAIEQAQTLVKEGKAVARTARKEIQAARKSDKKKKKNTPTNASAGSEKAMAVTMGTNAPNDAAKTKMSAAEGATSVKDPIAVKEGENDGMLDKIKIRLAELRSAKAVEGAAGEPTAAAPTKNATVAGETDKEAQLYPFENIAGAAEKVDNINAENAGQMISTIDSEIKGQPATDKDNPTINSELGQKDLPYKEEGKPTPDKKVAPAVTSKMSSDVVSTEVAEKARAHSIKNAVDKSKLSVELASQQQLKGLIDNPLKAAFIKNMTDAGINKEAAEAIAHNSFVDGYEESQKLVMKEAFDTFMGKPFDDFVKVASFTKEYIVKEGTELSPVEGEPKMDKKASVTTPPLRGSQVTDGRQDNYKGYWTDVKRQRRGF